MAKSEAAVSVRQGGRYIRDKVTGKLIPEQEYREKLPEISPETATPEPVVPAKKKGN